MTRQTALTDKELFLKLRNNSSLLAGNIKLKIYGHLRCTSGKRMHRQNRVFFENESDAIDAGFRPCGHCMRDEYNKWKNGII